MTIPEGRKYGSNSGKTQVPSNKLIGVGKNPSSSKTKYSAQTPLKPTNISLIRHPSSCLYKRYLLQMEVSITIHTFSHSYNRASQGSTNDVAKDMHIEKMYGIPAYGSVID